MAKKKTTEEFKEQVRAIHGDRYGLDLVEYVNNKVKLVCKKHGIFEMTPNCLLSGQNCPQCAKEEHAQKMTKDYDYVIGMMIGIAMIRLSIPICLKRFALLVRSMVIFG